MEEYIQTLFVENEELSTYTWVVYVLRSETNPNLMYCGMTNNLRRRLRQHNGCIKGGGKYTSANRPWKLAALIPNLKDRSEALKVEHWTKAKNYKSQEGIPTDCPVKRRIYLLERTMEIHDLEEVLYFDPDFLSL